MIEIVPFRDRFFQGVVDLILPIQQQEFGIPITLDAQPDLLDIAGYYQNGDGNFWVALHEEEIAGTIGLLDIGNHQGALRKMFVKAAFRGAIPGVARRLLDTLIEWCRRQNVGRIYLGTTDKFLAAHRFYEKNHFIEIERGRLPSTFPIMSVDTRFYQYSVAGRDADETA